MHQTMPGLQKKRYLAYHLDDNNRSQDARIKMLKSVADICHEKGFFDEVFVTSPPFYSIADQTHTNDRCKKMLEGKIMQSNNVVERLIYAQVLDRLAAEVLSDIDEAKIKPVYFRPKYRASPDCVLESMQKKLRDILSVIKPEQVINSSNSLFFLKHPVSPETLEEKGYTNIGKASLLSVARGKVIYEYNSKIFKKQIID